jgi:DNA invertase Pin-like site-specific DNA recombinase
MRCAIYARYSSDQQRATSIEDQIRNCRRYATLHGGSIVADHTYTDEAVSGASTSARTAFTALVEAATQSAPPFDCILVDDTSRIARNLADALRFYERLNFAGIRLIAVAQGVDSGDPQSHLMLGVHGLIDSVYCRELAQKTHRGMSGSLLRGAATGGRCFGYRSQPLRDDHGRDAGARLVVHPPEAAIVRRIYELSAAGTSFRKIARLLNAERVPSPQPYRGQRHASWSPAALSVMLRNQRYKGTVVWNKKRNIRHPETGRRIYRPRPESEWLRREEPALTIITPALWDRVQQRLTFLRSSHGQAAGGRRGRYLLSGLLVCGGCQSKLVLTGGRQLAGQRRGNQKYVCPLSERGVCPWTVQLTREPLERSVADAVAQALRSDHQEIISQLERQLARRAQLRAATAGAADPAMLQSKVDQLAVFISNGNFSPALIARLKKMESDLATARRAARSSPAASGATAATSQLQQLKQTLQNLPAAIASGPRTKEFLLRHLSIHTTAPQSRQLKCSVWLNGGGLNQSETESVFTLDFAA